VYKEPSEYPSYLSPKTPVAIDLMKKEEYDRKLNVINALYKKGSINQTQMTNRIAALEKEAHKIDDIGNNPLMYTKALEYCGKYFNSALKDRYKDIIKIKNEQEKRDLVNDILTEAKEMTTQEFSSE
jgi:6-phosphogluconate dehydrogenase